MVNVIGVQQVLSFTKISVFLSLVKEECKIPKTESWSQKMSNSQVSFLKMKHLVASLLQLVALWHLTEFCSPFSQIHKVCGKRVLKCSLRDT